MIPKVLHLYWGRNNPLSFLRYMTVVSFSRLNPDWNIIVHYPENACVGITWGSREHRVDMSGADDYFDRLDKIPQCETRLIVLEDIEPENGLAEVMRSDVVGWHILGEHGGWWSDFDILFIRPMLVLPIADSIGVVGSYQQDSSGQKFWSVGFLGSDAGEFAQDFFERVLCNACMQYDPKKYQSCGQDAYGPVHEKFDGDKRLLALPPAIVYPVASWEARQLYSRSIPRVAQSTIGIHWYGGFEQSQRAELAINETNLHKYSGLLIQWLRQVPA